MSFRLGLTGSIGMGKSTTAAMFRDLGVPVWDADAAVHELYARGGAAVAPIASMIPGAIRDDAVDREKLKAALKKDPDLLNRLESIVHPLVAESRNSFIETHADDPLIVLDVPLLFETGGETRVDAVLVVSTDAETQRQRVMDRPGMTDAMFDQIMARQILDAEKRKRAHYVIETNTLDITRQAVSDLVATLTKSEGGQNHA